MSRANLVDLAGSERFKAAGDDLLRRQESISINQSLTTLGLVISTLAAGGGKSEQHVPYRNSSSLTCSRTLGRCGAQFWRNSGAILTQFWRNSVHFCAIL